MLILLFLDDIDETPVLAGRLTLTNKALYFEASGALSYENALKIDLSRTEAGHRLSATSTGPWGVPLFDKAITYESEQQ